MLGIWHLNNFFKFNNFSKPFKLFFVSFISNVLCKEKLNCHFLFATVKYKYSIV